MLRQVSRMACMALGVQNLALRSGPSHSMPLMSWRAMSPVATSAGGSRGAAVLSPPAAQGMGSQCGADRLRAADLEVELVQCLDDNYCPIIHHKGSGATMIVDTPDARPILAALRAKGWEPTHILNTHHHYDHVGGNLELKQAFPSLQVVGPREHTFNYPGPYPKAGVHVEKIPSVDLEVGEGDEVQCGALKAQVLEVGGHTRGHIAYFFPSVPLLLSGDALFTLGCGRVFTGDFSRMKSSLEKLRALPDETIVFSAHEYTNSNLKFALEVESSNEALLERSLEVQTLREAGLPTVPTLLSHEKATNPFLRWDVPAVQTAVGATDPLAVFTAVRKWKDTGKKPGVAKL